MAALSPLPRQLLNADAFPGRPAFWRRWWPLLVLGLFCLAGNTSVQAQPREYQIKAVFLFNFLQFVEWPAEAFTNDHEPIQIGVLGDDPFGAALEEAVRGETVNARRIVLRRSSRLEDMRGCHLVFISKSENRRLDAALSHFASEAVLTVGEVDGFARRGGIIGFYSDGKKVRFEINAAAARRNSLKLSSELLSLGRIIGLESASAGGAP